ncbi:MAG: hypothetical protein ACJAT7_000191 [Psychromonas sp.]|jgi:hypothetical protein|uniref:hypothetical protein n=1 Tax=Psychromonas sp. TaxID=1884585 RepID=UPI0039E6A513
MKRMNSYILFTLLSFSQPLFAQPIVVWNRLLEHPNPMVSELLVKALQVTADEYGSFQLIPSEAMEQGRVVKQMANNGHVQIAVFAPTKEREESAIAVRIPVTGSLLSYRICLINKGQQERFKSVSSLDDLISSKLKIGTHRDWPDRTIMEANGLTLWKGHKYALLFEQLAAKRFDCFSRGANEVLQELDLHLDKELEIEQHLVIYYPLPFYYFVNKDNPELAVRLAKGLRMLIDNGEYEKIFKEKYAETLKILAIQDRVTIELSNPLLTEQSKVQMEKYKSYFQTLIHRSSL